MTVRGEGDPFSVAVGAAAPQKRGKIGGGFSTRPATPIIAPPDAVLAAINEAYQERTGQAQAFIEKLDRNTVLDEVRRLGAREDLLDNASRAPVIKLVNLMLFEAAKPSASDWPIPPYQHQPMLRPPLAALLDHA